MAAGGSSLSRFCTLIVLGRERRSCCALGDGGKVRKGGRGEGRCREVYLGSKRMEAGVMVWLRIANASFDPYNEAVVKSGGGSGQSVAEQDGG